MEKGEKQFLMEQAKRTTRHPFARFQPEDEYHEALLRSVDDDESLDDDKSWDDEKHGEPLKCGTLSWLNALRGTSAQKLIRPKLEPGETVFLLIVDLDAVGGSRLVYDGHSVAADAARADLQHHSDDDDENMDAESQDDSDEEEILDAGSQDDPDDESELLKSLVIFHPGHIDKTLGVVAVIDVGKGGGALANWNRQELLQPWKCAKDLKDRADSRSAPESLEGNFGKYVEDDL
jgi:hypothetical protein